MKILILRKKNAFMRNLKRRYKLCSKESRLIRILFSLVIFSS